jgi:hypothetical protein
MMADTPFPTKDLQQFSDLCFKFAQIAVGLTAREEIDEEMMGQVRQLRASCAVLLSGLNQVAAMYPGGFAPAPIV